MASMKRNGWLMGVAVLALVGVLTPAASAEEPSPAVSTATTLPSGPPPETQFAPYGPGGVPSESGPVELDHVESAELLVQESLSSGQTLRAGDVVRSANRQYRLVMQTDGNLVLYFARRALWNAGTVGHPGARAIMQGDGNLVVYAPRGGPALWSSGTAGHAEASLAVQTDGNLVIYDTARVARWATYTRITGLVAGERLKAGQWFASPNGTVKLSVRANGNVVVTGGNRTLFRTRTGGHPGAYLLMKTDGKLVVYSSTRRSLWSTGTAGGSAPHLDLQSEGNLVLYAGSQARWASNSRVDLLGPNQGLQPNQFLVSSSGAVQLHMQGDGNLVVYSTGRAVWSSGSTLGHPGASLVMQGDGNLVVYAPRGGPALWNTGTVGHPGANVVMQNDTNLVVYQDGRALWASNRPARPPQVTILNPVNGGTLSSSPQESPPHHTFVGDWAADVALGGAQPVYARFGNVTGALSLTIAGTGTGCSGGGGGLAVKINVSVDGTYLGYVWYLHFASLARTSGAISNGEFLGTQLTGPSQGPNCWTGPHIHIEPYQNSGFSCFVNRPRGSAVPTNGPIGVLGGSWASGRNATCPAGAEAQTTQYSLATSAPPAAGAEREG